MSTGGGGWTLAFTASDDGIDTWTWNNREALGTKPFTIGDPYVPNFDLMSQAYHNMNVTDILFIHQPSGIWAQYDDVGDGTTTLGEIIESHQAPACDYALGGHGYPLTAGTLSKGGLLCDTALYFNLGDHEHSIAACKELGWGSNNATYGPVWNAQHGSGCPFDDPALYGLGPHALCGACPKLFPDTEFNYLGFANALQLNTGKIRSGANYMQIYVR